MNRLLRNLSLSPLLELLPLVRRVDVLRGRRRLQRSPLVLEIGLPPFGTLFRPRTNISLFLWRWVLLLFRGVLRLNILLRREVLLRWIRGIREMFVFVFRRWVLFLLHLVYRRPRCRRLVLLVGILLLFLRLRRARLLCRGRCRDCRMLFLRLRHVFILMSATL